MNLRKLVDQGTATRPNQIVAAVLLPFLIPMFMAISVAVYLVVLGVLPGTFGALYLVKFLVGTMLLLLTSFMLFVAVKTGVFGLISIH